MSEKGGSLNRKFVAIFVFLGFFALLITWMPSEFLELGVTTTAQDKEAADFFTAQNVTMYNHTLSIDLTYGSSVQNQSGLPEGQMLEFWWDEEYVLGYSIGDMLEIRHLTDNLWGWWWGKHWLEVQEPYVTQGGVSQPDLGLKKDEVLALFDAKYNASYCEFACEHIAIKLFILPYNQSWTLEESWDNGYLKLFTSYDIDWTKTGTSMWTVLMQLMTFQNPNLGIGGVGGAIIGTGLALFLWANVAILVYAIVTAVIPFISGWRG